MRRIILFIVLVCLNFGCTNRQSENIDNKLDLVYLKSIDFPYKNFDLVIFNEYVFECGNMSEEELNKFYIPNFLNEPFNNNLEKKYHKKFISGFATDSIDLESKRVLYINVEGNVINKNEVLVKEYYSLYSRLHSTSKIINKSFVKKDGNWIQKK